MRKIERDVQKRIQRKIDALSADPRPTGVKQLNVSAGKYLRVRVGGYRVLYQVDDNSSQVLIVVIGAWKDVY